MRSGPGQTVLNVSSRISLFYIVLVGQLYVFVSENVWHMVPMCNLKERKHSPAMKSQNIVPLSNNSLISKNVGVLK